MEGAWCGGRTERPGGGFADPDDEEGVHIVRGPSGSEQPVEMVRTKVFLSFATERQCFSEQL